MSPGPLTFQVPVMPGPVPIIIRFPDGRSITGHGVWNNWKMKEEKSTFEILKVTNLGP